MAAATTDKFKKLARKWVGQIGAAGVSDASVTTVPLSSATNLPTDTGVVAVIDRVNSSGVKTPNLEETVVGVVSGTDLINCTRGAEGTAQAHIAGAVVEILFTAKGHNDFVDGILVEHNQDGTHKSALVTTLKSTGAEINTGTEDAKIVTPKGIADSKVAITDKAQTFTNKRVTKRVQSVADAATITPNADTDDVVDITAIAQAFTIANPSGTPTNKQMIEIEIKDNGTARAITWGNGYVAGGTALPTTTVLGKILCVLFQYSTANSLNKWRCLGTQQEV